jgi:hypothetical protein
VQPDRVEYGREAAALSEELEVMSAAEQAARACLDAEAGVRRWCAAADRLACDADREGGGRRAEAGASTADGGACGVWWPGVETCAGGPADGSSGGDGLSAAAGPLQQAGAGDVLGWAGWWLP